MIDSGLRATISCLDPQKMASVLAGAEFDHQFLDELPDGVDPCGENGEFHTCVWAGPMLSGTLDVTVGEVVTRDNFVYADLYEA